MDYCFYELKKNIVVVFHATEEKDGDNTPSTSPANAAWSLERLTEAWKIIRSI